MAFPEPSHSSRRRDVSAEARPGSTPICGREQANFLAGGIGMINFDFITIQRSLGLEAFHARSRARL
eukprot:scaffold416962_cov50-Prasinocladus_malaysianus.AAC.1